MDLRPVLQQLRAELNRITTAISALESADGTPAPAEAPVAAAPKKRRLSAAGKRRIIAATKARWARIRAEQSAGAAKAAPGKKLPPQPKTAKRVLSAAARKRISLAAKARWAAKKAKG